MPDVGERILVVDDELPMRTLLTDVITRIDSDLVVETAVDGRDAYTKLTATRYDLVVTDLSMPRMTGIELITQLHLAMPRLPIIVITALGDDAIILDCLREGAWDYITKPFHVEHVQAAVRRAVVVSRNMDVRPGDVEITSMGPGWLEITAVSEVEYVYRFRKFTEMLLRRRVPTGMLEDLRLAVEEIGRNAVEWGNACDRAKRVCLGFRLSDDRIELMVRDEGAGFKPEDVEDPSVDPIAAVTRRLDMGKRPGGYGIKIIKSIMDEMRYADDGRSVVMTKHLPPADAPD